MYITGSITDANPGPALHTLMATALTTAGYTLVDTVVISTKTHKVWKSPAASNAQNLDWYLDVAYTTTGTGSIWLVPFEYYDPATDLAYRGPHTITGTTIDATTSSRYGATGSALETNWSGFGTGHGSVLPVTTFGYWASITADRVILLQSNDATLLMYTGFYQPDPLYAAKAGAALFPLIQWRGSANSDAASASSNPPVALTRIPPAASLSGWQNTVQVKSNTALLLRPLPPIPTGPFTSYAPAAVPIPVTSVGVFLPITVYGSLRDTAAAPTAGVVRGDTVTIGADTWVLTTTGGSSSVLFKAV